jgi:hypothetical protein
MLGKFESLPDRLDVVNPITKAGLVGEPHALAIGRRDGIAARKADIPALAARVQHRVIFAEGQTRLSTRSTKGAFRDLAWSPSGQPSRSRDLVLDHLLSQCSDLIVHQDPTVVRVAGTRFPSKGPFVPEPFGLVLA